MMPNSDLLPSLLFKINQNQMALEAAIMELTLWVEQRDSGAALRGGEGRRQAGDAASDDDDVVAVNDPSSGSGDGGTGSRNLSHAVQSVASPGMSRMPASTTPM